MLNNIDSTEKTGLHRLSVVSVSTAADNGENSEALSEAEIRRRMYERIARGNALAEVEEKARREWQRGR